MKSLFRGLGYGTLYASSLFLLLWSCSPSRADYRLNCAAGGVCTFKSTVAAGVNTQHVIVDSAAAPSGSATEAKQDSQITQETAINTLLGLQADAACGADDGSCTLSALVKRLNQRLTTLNTTLGTPLQAGGTIVGPLTDTQLRATPVPVSGTFFQATQPVSLAVAPALVASSAIIGNVRIDQTTPGTTNAVSLAQLGANTISTGLGAAGTGVLRVAIASDSPGFALFGASVPLAGVAIGINNGGTLSQLAAASGVGDGNTGGLTLSSGSYYFNGSNWDRVRGDTTSGAWVNVKAATPPTAIAPVVSTTAEANRILKASAGSLLTLTVTIGATSGYLLIFNSTTAPADGAVTPLYCSPIFSNGTNGSVGLQWQVPLSFSTGITASFSTTGCFTKTASATANFFGQIQ